MQFNKIFVSEDIDSNNLGVTTTLKSMGYTNIDHAQYCDDTLLKIKKEIQNKSPFDLLITDLSFENPRVKKTLNSGIDLIKAVKEIDKTIKIVVFSVEDDHNTIKTLFEEESINAYVCKGLNGLKELKNSIEAISKNGLYTCPIATIALHEKNVKEIDEYDLELLSYLAKGFRQNEISVLLKEKDVSPNSVRSIESTISKLKDYFNATNTTHLIYVASNMGLI
ncbi:response regulator [Cellulophaga baltica]|uniref:DNA-binding response regulator n=1 Tax=Cellulophaga TaxID=104264 RepID=UPI001C066A9F|nr:MULTISPECIES: response regulator [Cellulophaga]MBU2997337.1 response regulator [Cellulophaga baltica]MDO6768735.1 response regulator [Cellulophaga sp. 1_MG-2023]